MGNQQSDPIRIKVDLDAAFWYLRTDEAHQVFTKKDVARDAVGDAAGQVSDPTQLATKKERYIGKKPCEILRDYILRYVIPDPTDETVGYVDVTYQPSEIGAALMKAGFIKGARVYGGASDPFSLPGRLNEILTSRFYHNADMSKCYQRIMLSRTKDPEAIAVLEELLQDPKTLYEDIGRYYFQDYCPQIYARLKMIVNSLAMDRKLESVRKELIQDHGVDPDLPDHPFLVRYAGAMRRVTDEFATQGDGPAAIAMLKEEFPMRERKGKKVKRNSKLTWKSFRCQDPEFQCREVMKGATETGGHGSEEHGGLKVLITEATRDPAVVETMLTDAIQERLGVTMPIDVKPPAPFDLTWKIFDPKHFVEPGPHIKSPRALQLYHRMTTWWVDRFFATLICGTNTVVRLAYDENGEVSFDHFPSPLMTTQELMNTFRGMYVPSSGGYLDGPEEEVDDMGDETDDDAGDDEDETGEETANPTHYETMGVATDASPAELKNAYYKLALERHPDKGGSDAAFQRLNDAWETLKDPEKRKAYDEEQSKGAEEEETKKDKTQLEREEARANFFKLEKRKALMLSWLENTDRHTRTRVEFEPNHPTKDAINLFRGLPFDRDLWEGLIDDDPDLLQPVLDHVRHVLADGDEARDKYILDWFAACVQWKRKILTLLIFIGKQGAGKDVIQGPDGLMPLIFGKTFQFASALEHLTTHFNADSAGKLFVCADEVNPGRMKKNSEAIKNLSRSSVLRYEKKGIDAEAVSDHRNIVFTSNNEEAFVVEDGDRTLVIMRVSDELAQVQIQSGNKSADEVTRHFAHLLGARYSDEEAPREATLEDKTAVARVFFKFLMERDLTYFIPKHIPASELREEQMIKDPLPEFFKAWSCGDLATWGDCDALVSEREEGVES